MHRCGPTGSASGLPPSTTSSSTPSTPSTRKRQARITAAIECELPSGTRFPRPEGSITYPIAEPAKPVDVRLDAIESIRVVSVEGAS